MAKYRVRLRAKSRRTNRERPPVLTGMRTTGKLHLGHFVGALENWREVQNSGEYNCYFLLADLQALTTHAQNPELLLESIRDVVLDWIGVGLNPELRNVHFVLQSQVLERAMLSQLLTMIARYGEVMRNPTLKSELKEQKDATVGFMVYPVDQVADILMVSPYPPKQGDFILVPVGEDQVPHLEYTNVLARRFNQRYGKVFALCRPLIGRVGRLVGLNNPKEKASKSRGNVIYLSDDPKTVEEKAMGMYTDPTRIHSTDPGHVENNPLFDYLFAFHRDRAKVEEFARFYRQGKIGDVPLKKELAREINVLLDPIRERRAQAQKEADIRAILEAGSQAARKTCRPILEAVKEKMYLQYPK